MGCVCCLGATLAGGRKCLPAQQFMGCMAPRAHTQPATRCHAQAAEHPAAETLPSTSPSA